MDPKDSSKYFAPGKEFVKCMKAIFKDDPFAITRAKLSSIFVIENTLWHAIEKQKKGWLIIKRDHRSMEGYLPDWSVIVDDDETTGISYDTPLTILPAFQCEEMVFINHNLFSFDYTR
ncbi:hypothetical protein EDD86DRAFT_248683 [Gorgonomyces haynaldii]|nr:hypothetical protein EDD86DRAFT_248683 [Gorgonomyces haynaldii]